MTPQELKNSILQLAIQGKLVEQRPEEGTAEELYRQIQAEKQALIKAGKIKKEKPLPEITEDEIPFDIPESWMFVRLGEAFCLEMGQSPDGSTVSELSDGIEFHQGKVHFGKTELQLSPQKTTAPTKFAEPYSALLCVRAPVGKVNITRRKICIGRGLCAVKPICKVSVEFVYYWLTTLENIFIKKATGTTFVAITGDIVKNQIIPFPPLAEQKRIVAKIEELLPLVDRYEEAWTKLEDFNKRFPMDMQKSLLQMAIQGKLVEQRPEEGTGEELFQQIQVEKQRLIKAGTVKKEKPLPEITGNEIPFDTPESWTWVRLPAIADMCLGKMLDKQKNTGTPMAYLRNVNVRWGSFDLSDLLEMKFEDIEDERYLIRKNDIVMCEGGEPGRCAVWNEDTAIHFQKALHRIRLAPGLSVAFFYYVFCLYSNNGIFSGLFTGTTIKHLTGQSLDKIIVPLPPLAEQKRIVAKLEEILPLCEKIEVR